MSGIRVLIVDDDPTVREIHRKFVAGMTGFTVVGESAGGLEAQELLKKRNVNLILLDIFMPGLDGLNTLRQLREGRRDLDVIVVSAARSSEIIKEAARLGVFDYQVKPFNFERFKLSLEAYRRFHAKLNVKDGDFSQEEIDRVFHAKEEGTLYRMPKGLQQTTLKKVLLQLQNCRDGLSSEDAASVLGVSRVTARRYLEYLVSAGKAIMEPEYRETGRPVNKYRML